MAGISSGVNGDTEWVRKAEDKATEAREVQSTEEQERGDVLSRVHRSGSANRSWAH